MVKKRYRIVGKTSNGNLITFSIVETSFENAIKLFKDKFKDEDKLVSITYNGQVNEELPVGIFVEIV